MKDDYPDFHENTEFLNDKPEEYKHPFVGAEPEEANASNSIVDEAEDSLRDYNGPLEAEHDAEKLVQKYLEASRKGPYMHEGKDVRIDVITAVLLDLLKRIADAVCSEEDQDDDLGVVLVESYLWLQKELQALRKNVKAGYK